MCQYEWIYCFENFQLLPRRFNSFRSGLKICGKFHWKIDQLNAHYSSSQDGLFFEAGLLPTILSHTLLKLLNKLIILITSIIGRDCYDGQYGGIFIVFTSGDRSGFMIPSHRFTIINFISPRNCSIFCWRLLQKVANHTDSPQFYVLEFFEISIAFSI